MIRKAWGGLPARFITRNKIYVNNYSYTTYPPGSINLIRIIADLAEKAAGKDATNGHSYEVFGSWHNIDTTPPYIRKTLKTVLTYQIGRAHV